MKETGVKIHVPPPSVNRDEITIAGDKEGVQMAIEKIKNIYAIMVYINMYFNPIINYFNYVLNVCRYSLKCITL
jgi:spore maturation protein SpmB